MIHFIHCLTRCHGEANASSFEIGEPAQPVLHFEAWTLRVVPLAQAEGQLAEAFAKPEMGASDSEKQSSKGGLCSLPCC